MHSAALELFERGAGPLSMCTRALDIRSNAYNKRARLPVMAIGTAVPGALAALAVVALAATTAAAAGTAHAQSYPVVCGDRLCSEVPGGYHAWMREWSQAAASAPPATPDVAASDAADAPDAADNSYAAALGMPEPSTRQLADGVHMIDYLGYVTLVVASGEDVLITDPANDMRAAAVRDEVAKITGNPVTMIVLTHEHYDHAGGTSLFADADVVCQANCAATFALDPFGRVPDEVDVTFDEFLGLEVGGKRVELHSFGPADGEATTVVYLPDDLILYTADLYEPRGFTDGRWLGDVSYPGKRIVLDTIAEWPMVHAVNSHSAETDPEYLRESAAMVGALYDAVYAELSGPVADGDFFAIVGLMDTLPHTLDLEEYAEWRGYDEHFPAHVSRMMMGMFHGD